MAKEKRMMAVSEDEWVSPAKINLRTVLLGLGVCKVCECVSRFIYVWPLVCVSVYRACVCCVCVQPSDQCHLGAMWYQTSASWKIKVRMCINMVLSALGPDWVGKCVGAYVFHDFVCVCNRFHSAAPSVRVVSLESFLPFSSASSVNQPLSLIPLCVSPTLLRSSPSNFPTFLPYAPLFILPLQM